jgi:integrase
VRKLRWDQVQDGCLCVTQGKTKVKLRIAIKGDLAAVLERARTRGAVKGLWILVDPLGQLLKEFGYLRSSFDMARDAAEKEAEELGIPFRRWQIRDLRPKCASDLGSMVEARKLLGHRTEVMTAHYVRKRVGDKVEPLK